MASKKEVTKHLQIALKEIGEIKPYFDKNTKEWLYKHKNYPVEYAGESIEEVKKNYPFYLKEFISERLDKNLDPYVEKETKGKAGKKEIIKKIIIKSTKQKRILVPEDLAFWLKNPENVEKLMHLIKTHK